MQLKKWLVSLLAVTVGTVVFALPLPPESGTSQADLMQQYTAQMEEMNRTFDQAILPSIKGLVGVVKDLESSGAENLSQDQENRVNGYVNQLTQALENMVAPVVAEIDINQYNQQMKLMGATDIEFTKQDLNDQMMAFYLMMALSHFEDANLLNEEELAIVVAIFFPEELEEGAAQ